MVCARVCVCTGHVWVCVCGDGMTLRSLTAVWSGSLAPLYLSHVVERVVLLKHMGQKRPDPPEGY